MRAHQGLFIALLTSSSLASAQEAQPVPNATPLPAAGSHAVEQSGYDPALRVFLDEQHDAMGRRCELSAVFASGSLRYLACGDAGVWVVRIGPKGALMIVEQHELEGSAGGLFVRNGYLWVEVATVQARRLAASDSIDAQELVSPLSPTSPAPHTSPEPARGSASPPPARMQPPRADAPVVAPRAKRSARVVAVEPGVVVVNMGTSGGVNDGDHVSFYQTEREDLGAEQGAQRHRELAVGKVVSVAPERARVVLGLDERVPLGAFAQRTGEPLTASSVAPPRTAGLWEIGFVARPFLVLQNLGAGAFVDGRAGYRTEGGLHVEALLEPFAVAAARQGTSVPFAALVSAGYDARLFEVGFGLGGQTLYQPAFDLGPGTGLTLAQRLRLGARDGLMVEAISYVVLFHSRFEFSSLRIQGQIPLSDGAWLLLAGGGGSLGLGYGELGLRLLLVGNGDRGSFFLRTMIGGVNLFKNWPCLVNPVNGTQTCKENIDYAGPMIGAGGEWRL